MFPDHSRGHCHPLVSASSGLWFHFSGVCHWTAQRAAKRDANPKVKPGFWIVRRGRTTFQVPCVFLGFLSGQVFQHVSWILPNRMQRLFRAIKRLVKVVAGPKWNFEKKSHGPAWAKPAYFSDGPASTATAGLKNLVPTQTLIPEIKFEIPTPDGVRQFEGKEVDESLICEVRGMATAFFAVVWRSMRMLVDYSQKLYCHCYGCDSLVRCAWVKKWFSKSKLWICHYVLFYRSLNTHFYPTFLHHGQRGIGKVSC